MAFVEDLSPFFADFGVSATVGGASVTGIFDAAYADELGIGGIGPTFRCKSTDVASAVAGTAVTINATSYTIAGPVEHDGTGMALIHLRDA
jgi:hypothetical protein